MATLSWETAADPLPNNYYWIRYTNLRKCYISAVYYIVQGSTGRNIWSNDHGTLMKDVKVGKQRKRPKRPRPRSKSVIHVWWIELLFFMPAASQHAAIDFSSLPRPTHDYYSIWFNFSAAFFISEKKAVVIKLKTHYFISHHFMKC
jgi:hypothetical protein